MKHNLREAVAIGLNIAIETQDLHVLWVLLGSAGADRHQHAHQCYLQK